MNIVVLVGILVMLVTGIPVFIQLMRTHPKGLIVLFFTEMWERFSYYGMRGILIFYLTQHFLFDDASAAAQYGAYTSLVYLLPLIGGLLADRYLGTRKAIFFGAILLVAGHFTMAYEGEPARQTLTYAGTEYAVETSGRVNDVAARIVVDGQGYAFVPGESGSLALKDLPAGAPLPAMLPRGSYTLEETRDPIGTGIYYLALALIIMGVGFLKPNISVIVGQLYDKNDPRRDAGFTLYYYGINIGAFWAAAICGLLGQYVGWWAGFGLAGVGMAMGFVAFALGKPLLQGKGAPPDVALLRAPVFGVRREWAIYLAALAGIAAVWFVVQRPDWVGWALNAATVASIAAVAYILAFVCKTRIERKRMSLAMVLIVGSVVFWTLFEQSGSSINLFTARNVELDVTASAHVYSLLGMDIAVGTRAQLTAAGISPGAWWQLIDTAITAPQTQSFGAGFVLLLAPAFAALWAWLGRRGADPNPTLKFALALFQAGLAFFAVAWSGALADANAQMPLLVLVLTYLLVTTGELCLSPVGLSQVSRLSLPAVASFMMAVWFLSTSVAQYLAGWVATFAGTATVGGQVLDPHLALATSLSVFEKLGWAGIATGAAYFVLSFFVRHWAHDEGQR